MKTYSLVILLCTLGVQVHCQNMGNDSVFIKFMEERNYIKDALMHIRFETDRNDIFRHYYSLPEFYSFPDTITSTYYKGINVSYYGIMSDTIIQNRIISLLNNEFYDGELDSLVGTYMQESQWFNKSENEIALHKDSIKRSLLVTPFLLNQALSGGSHKKRSFIRALVYIDNSYIDKKIVDMYCDKRYANYSDVIQETILRKGIQPYTDRIIAKCKYNDKKTYGELMGAIITLRKLGTPYTYKLLSEYLLSEVFYERDLNELRDISPSEENEPKIDIQQNKANNTKYKSDTVYVAIDLSSISIDEDDEIADGAIDYGVERCYIYEEAYLAIQGGLRNEEFLEGGEFYNLKPRLKNKDIRLRLYHWMRENNSHYKIRLKW